MVNGCGLDAETTTCLSALNIEISKDEISKALIENIPSLNRRLSE